jgi:hypothetical protein
MRELYMHRESEESWREAVARQGRKHGLEAECLEEFDAEMRQNPRVDEAFAAWNACYEWDALDITAAPVTNGER